MGFRGLLTRWNLQIRLVMKLKHIIALAISVVFIGIAAFALVDNKIDYTDFEKAAQTGRRTQVSGTYVKDKGANYDAKLNILTFIMKDRQGKELPVRFKGVKPNNFELAPSVVCVGKIEGGVFEASDIQTKCPSRYEGSGKMKPAEAGS
jgi:cytochrome c-type biogenesis protein CcmE